MLEELPHANLNPQSLHQMRVEQRAIEQQIAAIGRDEQRRREERRSARIRQTAKEGDEDSVSQIDAAFSSDGHLHIIDIVVE